MFEDANLLVGADHFSDAGVYRLRDEYIPIIRMTDVFSVQPSQHDYAGELMVVVEGDGQKVGLIVDDLLAQQQVVVKSLEPNFRRVDGLSGATILGDGTVALILDVAGLIKFYSNGGGRTPSSPQPSDDALSDQARMVQDQQREIAEQSRTLQQLVDSTLQMHFLLQEAMISLFSKSGM